MVGCTNQNPVNIAKDAQDSSAIKNLKGRIWNAEGVDMRKQFTQAAKIRWSIDCISDDVPSAANGKEVGSLSIVSNPSHLF